MNVRAQGGQTALAWALLWGNTATVKVVVEAGAAPPVVDPQPALPKFSRAQSAREAVERSVGLLQTSSPVFFTKSGCVGCRHQMLTLMAAGEARGRGISTDEKLTAEIVKVATTVNRPLRVTLLQRVHVGGAPMTESLYLVGLGAQNYPADELTDAFVHDIAGQQFTDGSWHGLDNRPPIEYSPFSETADGLSAAGFPATRTRPGRYCMRQTTPPAQPGPPWRSPRQWNNRGLEESPSTIE